MDKTKKIIVLLREKEGNVMQLLVNISSSKNKTFHFANKSSTILNTPKVIPTKDIESLLEFDKIQPIRITASDEQDTIEKGDYFGDWYEQELRSLYSRNSK